MSCFVDPWTISWEETFTGLFSNEFSTCVTWVSSIRMHVLAAGIRPKCRIHLSSILRVWGYPKIFMLLAVFL